MSWCSERGIPHSEFLSWPEDDRAKLVAFLMESGEKCQMCGTAPWEWDEDPYAYEAMGHRCQGCYVKDLAREDGNPGPGTTITLIPRRRAEEIKEAPSRLPRRRS